MSGLMADHENAWPGLKLNERVPFGTATELKGGRVNQRQSARADDPPPDALQNIFPKVCNIEQTGLIQYHMVSF